MIRLAHKQDVERMLEIYAPYVRETAISFEYIPPTMEEFGERFDRITRKYPWIVWEQDGRVLGYAYADEAFSRAAYQWDADLSIYLDREIRQQGIGTQLYDCIERVMRRAGYHNLYGVVTGANLPSCRFHEKRGYELQGLLKNAGYKFGKWYDVRWYALSLKAEDAANGAPKPFEPAMLEEFI